MSFENSVPHSTPALLALEDGNFFHGISVGYLANTVGEVVFNTSMTGYQEILTDPSYAQQIVTLTYPHIGNVGVNLDDFESKHAQAAGLIIRNMSPISSNWRSTQTLPQFLQEQKIVAIANIDTRRLTHILREKGAQRGCIMTGNIDVEKAIAQACAFSGLNGKDLASVVSTKNQYYFSDELRSKFMEVGALATTPHHIIVLDFGVKHNILRILANHNCKLTIIPARTSAEDILKLKPNGIILSNGPGDPAACNYAIDTVKILLTKKIPILGICLGFQILALAFGAKTKKMKFGHHGSNHPVQDLKTKKVYITSQNHGFCVDEKTLPAELEITHVSLFDKTLQGFKHKKFPAIAFQGHPEASPGPNDIAELFDEFISLLNEASRQKPA